MIFHVIEVNNVSFWPDCRSKINSTLKCIYLYRRRKKSKRWVGAVVRYTCWIHLDSIYLGYFVHVAAVGIYRFYKRSHGPLLLLYFFFILFFFDFYENVGVSILASCLTITTINNNKICYNEAIINTRRLM